MLTQTEAISRGQPDRLGTELQEISNAMVRIYKQLFGRGPTVARSAYAGRDTLIVTLENSLTRAERNLVACGQRQWVEETRAVFQAAAERDFVQTVEAITGRRVRAFVSGTDTAHDVSTEIFYLEPEAE